MKVYKNFIFKRTEKGDTNGRKILWLRVSPVTLSRSLQKIKWCDATNQA